MKKAIFLISFLSASLAPSILEAGIFYSDGAVTNRDFSSGFRFEGSIYFLYEQKTFLKGNDGVLFLPFSVPDKILSRKINLYRVGPEGKKAESLAEVQTDKNTPVNIRYAFFTKSGTTMVFAFPVRRSGSKAETSALEIYLWNSRKGILVHVRDREKRAYYEEYFPGSPLPFELKEGMISASVLTNRYLKDFPRD